MLTYLFRAYFTDGSTFEQTQKDKARLKHPRKGKGSAFTDLLWLLEQEGKTLAAFALLDPESRPVAAVHMDSGRFELGENDFYAGEEGLGADVARRLVYYRAVTRERMQDVDPETHEPLSEWREVVRVRYYLGWQATVDGKNVQHVIGLDG